MEINGAFSYNKQNHIWCHAAFCVVSTYVVSLLAKVQLKILVETFGPDRIQRFPGFLPVAEASLESSSNALIFKNIQGKQLRSSVNQCVLDS